MGGSGWVRFGFGSGWDSVQSGVEFGSVWVGSGWDSVRFDCLFVQFGFGFGSGSGSVALGSVGFGFGLGFRGGNQLLSPP